MGLKAELKADVKATFESDWTVQKAQAVPEAKDLRLNSNHAKDLETATVLYADLDGSTAMVDSKDWWFSAEVYETFLRCAAKIIRSEGGVISAYDGDRVMAVFTGGSKNSSAVRAALKLNYAVKNIIQPALKNRYPATDFELRHVCGIDSTQVRVARIGVHGDNDLVWIGRAPNYAAKLTSIGGYPTWVTKAVFSSLPKDLTEGIGGTLWEERSWTAMNKMPIFCSNAWCSFG
jgi:class 3 adenylate cyclase